MAERKEVMERIYGNIDEDSRLSKSRAGEMEYFTTMNYIHRYLKGGSSVIEIGAGTGQYSVRLARECHDVTSVELVGKNIEVLEKKASLLKNISIRQGDAVKLSGIKDESFELTLVLGPMYHLYEREEINRAIDEAIRVTKKGGVLMFAFLSVHAIMMAQYMNTNLEAGLRENFDEALNVLHFKEQGFTGYMVRDFEKLFEARETEYITTVATDGCLELLEKNPSFSISDHNFNLYKKYHLAFCEQRELLSSSNHLLYICRRK